MKSLFLLAFLVCSPLWATTDYMRGDVSAANKAAAALPFLTKTQLLSLSINAVAMTADIVTSRQAIDRGGRESNPIMGGKTTVLFKVGEMALVTVISYQLYRHGHVKMARILPLITAAPSGFSAIHNAGVR